MPREEGPCRVEVRIDGTRHLIAETYQNSADPTSDPRIDTNVVAFDINEALLEAGWEAGLAAVGRDGLPGHAEAAARWREFGNVPERAYALLGQGRCLAALRNLEAEAPLREARELFATMGYKPALAETEALIGESEAAAV